MMSWLFKFMIVICFCVIQFDYGTSENNNTRHGKKSMYSNMTDFMICLQKSQMLTKLKSTKHIFYLSKILYYYISMSTSVKVLMFVCPTINTTFIIFVFREQVRCLCRLMSYVMELHPSATPSHSTNTLLFPL